jgi:hypothetical protein
MTEPTFHDSVKQADRWSKVAALVAAVVAFVSIRSIVTDAQFASVIAAAMGIAVRLYIPYHANLRIPEAERTPLADHPAVGEYHHGAAGLGLFVSSLVAVGAFVATHALVTAVGVGVIAGGVGYVLFLSVLPDE